MKAEVTETLNNLGVEYTLKQNETPAFTCVEVSLERDISLDLVLKCLVGVASDGHTCIMLIPGNRKLDLKKLYQLSEQKIQLVSREELEACYGVIVGAISPIQFFGKAKFFLDDSILLETIIDISGGSPNSGIQLKASELVRLLVPIIGNIT
jgi:prolyl-tRNA editing enzyme YbaK/EbsC (Cys-tRNA(Pro) deacylase)